MNISSLLNALPGACAQGLIWGVMAVGVYITYKILDIADLSVDGTMATGAAVCLILMTNGCPIWLAIVCAVLSGVLAGFVTGVFHVFMGIPVILAGILTQLGLYSINLRILGYGTTAGTSSNLAISVDRYQLLVSLRYVRELSARNPIFVCVLVVALLIAVMYWFFGTELGCSIRATGANVQMCQAQGINTNRNKLLGLMISNGIVALSSALLCQYQGFADVNMGRGAIVIGLAAVIIGEVIFGKLFINFALKLLAVTFGAIIYYLVIQVVLWLGLTSSDLKLISAIIVAFFLAVPYWKERYLTRPRKEG